MRIEALGEESAPVVRRDGIEVGHDLVKIVGHHLGRSVAADGQKLYAKIVQRFLPVGQLADGSIRIQPEQLAFLIVVLAAPPVGPVGVVSTKNLGGNGRVFEGCARCARASRRAGRRSRPAHRDRPRHSRRRSGLPARCPSIASCPHRPRAGRPSAEWHNPVWPIPPAGGICRSRSG